MTGAGFAVGNHTFVFTATDNASHPALGDVGQHFGPAIQSPASAPPGGGGFGGGGGGGVVGAGVTNIVMYTNSDGLFNLPAVIKSDDGKLLSVSPRESSVAPKTTSPSRASRSPHPILLLQGRQTET